MFSWKHGEYKDHGISSNVIQSGSYNKCIQFYYIRTKTRGVIGNFVVARVHNKQHCHGNGEVIWITDFHLLLFRMAPTISVQNLILGLILEELYTISLVARVHS